METTLDIRAPRTAAPTAPPPPASLEETGLSEEFVAGLVLKALYLRGSALGFELADLLALPLSLLDEVLRGLQEQRLLEVPSTRGPSRGEYVFKLTGEGRKRGAEEMGVSRYVGPAPVPFEDFQRWVGLQAVDRVRVTEPELRAALEGITVTDDLLGLLGPALNSGRSLFLHGAPGDGKTLLADRVARLFGDRYYVPYAVLVDGSVMVVHDPVHHADRVGGEEATGNEEPWDAANGDGVLRDLPAHDRRYAEARRPVVVTGGELTLDQLDLRWDPSGRMYQAPPQLKAAGGVLVVDDLGRQRVPVTELLNRWVVPLEQRQDYLTLRSGRKIVVPFDCFVIFSTNLEPAQLADEAFLRRIHYKIHVAGPERAEFERIFRAACQERGIPFDPASLDALYQGVYDAGEAAPRRCHPRDLLDHLCDLADYRGEAPRLDPQRLAHAARSYFLPGATWAWGAPVEYGQDPDSPRTENGSHE